MSALGAPIKENTPQYPGISNLISQGYVELTLALGCWEHLGFRPSPYHPHLRELSFYTLAAYRSLSPSLVQQG